MKNKSLIFIFSVVLLASCSTAYKTGQTPDDLYYSKGKIKAGENTLTQRKEESHEDRQIRMAAHDTRWRTLDDHYSYNNTYSPYQYGYGYGYYFNPYYCPYPVYSPAVKFVNPVNTTIRTTNLGGYNNTISTYTPTKGSGNVKTTTIRGYNYNNTNTTRDNHSDTRTYTPQTNNNTQNNTSTNNNNNNNNNNSNSHHASSGSSVTRPVRN